MVFTIRSSMQLYIFLGNKLLKFSLILFYEGFYAFFLLKKCHSLLYVSLRFYVLYLSLRFTAR